MALVLGPEVPFFQVSNISGSDSTKGTVRGRTRRTSTEILLPMRSSTPDMKTAINNEIGLEHAGATGHLEVLISGEAQEEASCFYTQAFLLHVTHASALCGLSLHKEEP